MSALSDDPTAVTPSPEERRSPLWWLPAPDPRSPQIILLVAALLAVPFIFLPFDVMQCWLVWGQASLGYAPWRIYLTRPDCNYPPFELYLLTIQDAIRRLFHADPYGTVAVYLVKVPNILAHIAGGLISYSLLRKGYGERYARQVALLYALSLPLFVNAALWGQADALLSLAMVLTVALLMADKPVPAGAAMGWALSIKLQAVVIVPVLLLYTFRKYGWQTLLKAVVTGVAVLFALALPFLIAGAGKQLWNAYFVAAGYYQQRTLNAFNLWGFLYYSDIVWKHIPDKIASPDNVAVLGPLTYKHIGILLFASALAFILRVLWKRPEGRMLAWASALSVLAFFTLCTQMHERYGIPGAALLTLVAPESLFALLFFVVTNFAATWNQWVILLANWAMYYRLSPFFKIQLSTWLVSFLYISILNCLLFVVGMLFLRRQLAEAPSATPPQPSV